MKIIIPVDFSEFSLLAVKLAIQLKELIDFEVVFFHSIDCVDLDKVYDAEYLDIAFDSIEKDCFKKLGLLEDKMKNASIEATSLVVRRSFVGSFLEHLKATKYDLVIIGSHGKSGFDEMFIGSNTQKVLRKSPTNVLIVKKEVGPINFKETVFATGLSLKDQETFRFSLGFLKSIGVKKIHILAINTGSYFTQPTILMLEALKDFEQIADQFDAETHFYTDYSVESGIRHFAQEKNVNLIAISNHNMSPIRRIFQGSNVEMIVNSSPCPVLAMNYNHYLN